MSNGTETAGASADLPAPKSSASAQPATTSAGSGAVRLAAIAFLGIVALMLLVWPYQHGFTQGSGESRISMGLGIYHIVINKSEWIYCLAVPVLIGIMVWMDRKRLAKIPVSGDRLGLVLLAISLAIYWVGYKADKGLIGYAAIQLMTAGLVLWLFGRDWMRALFYPWLFLLFFWPMIFLEQMIALPLRYTTAPVSAGVLNLIGVSTDTVGPAIYSSADPAAGLAQGDRFKLDVAEACSGLRSLFSLTMIAAFYGFISLKKGWQRGALILSAVPLAMLGNVARMVVLSLATIQWGSEFAIGSKNPDGSEKVSPFHGNSGLVIFALLLVALFALARFLESARLRKRLPAFLKKKPKVAAHTAESGEVAPVKRRGLIGAGLAAAVIGLCAFTPVSTKLALPSLSSDIPEQVGDFRGKREGITPQEKRIFEPGVEVTRVQYGNPVTGELVSATMVLSGEVERSLHKPQDCLPAQGWTIRDQKVVEVPLPSGESIQAMRLDLFNDRINEEGQRIRYRAVNLFWYQGADHISTPSYYMHVFLGMRDNLFRNINHRWAMASFMTYLRPISLDQPTFAEEMDYDMGSDSLKAFIGDLAPILQEKAKAEQAP